MLFCVLMLTDVDFSENDGAFIFQDSTPLKKKKILWSSSETSEFANPPARLQIPDDQNPQGSAIVIYGGNLSRKSLKIPPKRRCISN